MNLFRRLTSRREGLRHRTNREEVTTMNDQMHETAEGFTLYRQLLLPDARDFAEVLTYVRPWDFDTMSHRSGVIPRPDLVPDPVRIGDNELGPYCSVNMREGGRFSLAVTPTAATVEVIARRIVTDDDRLSFEVIYHPENDRCLILAHHGYIIGSHWLAYVDPRTLPIGAGGWAK